MKVVAGVFLLVIAVAQANVCEDQPDGSIPVYACKVTYYSFIIYLMFRDYIFIIRFIWKNCIHVEKEIQLDINLYIISLFQSITVAQGSPTWEQKLHRK